MSEYKVLPQMRRLMKEILEQYDLTVASVVCEKEYAVSPLIHRPYYIVELGGNDPGWTHISLRPLKGRTGGFSKSENNIVAVALKYEGRRCTECVVLPSWRGHLVSREKLREPRYLYYIESKYLPVTAGIDFVEDKLIKGESFFVTFEPDSTLEVR